MIKSTLIPKNSLRPKDSGLINTRITAMMNGTIINPLWMVIEPNIRPPEKNVLDTRTFSENQYNPTASIATPPRNSSNSFFASFN